MPEATYYGVYLQAGLREAENYLLSKELFWPLNISPPAGQPGYPNLTLGGLLLYAAYARALAEGGSPAPGLAQMEAELNAVRTRWRAAWERKAAWEFKSRLRQWGNVLKEIRIDPENNISYYRYEVRLRVQLDLLEAEVRAVEEADQEHLAGLDLLLRALFAPGDFTWDPAMVKGFPAERFWYLWGELREP